MKAELHMNRKCRQKVSQSLVSDFVFRISSFTVSVSSVPPWCNS
jgi:hypothetical protein